MGRTNPVILQKVQNPRGAVIFFGKTPKDYIKSLDADTGVSRHGGICDYNVYKSWGQIIKDDIISCSLLNNIILVYEKPTTDSESLRKRFNACAYTYDEFSAKILYSRLAYNTLEYIGKEVYCGEDFNISHPKFGEPVCGKSLTDMFAIVPPSSRVSELPIVCDLENHKYIYDVPMVQSSVPIPNDRIVKLMGEGFDRAVELSVE